MRMLLLVINLDNWVKTDWSFVFAIKTVKSLSNQRCYFLWHCVFHIFEEFSIIDTVLFLIIFRSTFGWVKITNISNFLSGEKDSCFIEEKIKEMWGEVMILLRVKLLNMLIKEVKGLYSFAIHLHFHFIKDLVRLVSPVHEVTKIL